MSFKWTPAQPRSANIVDSTQVNDSYTTYKGALNGSLDRTNLPHASIGRTQLANNFAHKVSVSNFGDTAGGYVTAGLGFRGYTYKQYQSGWSPIHSQSIDCKEGMLHIEVSGIAAVYKGRDYYTCKIANFKITVNGLDVAFSADYGQNIMPIYMVADIPCAEGANEVRLYRRLTPADTLDPKDKPWIFTDGGSLLLINRYR